jgi:hypothetical protein
LGGWLGQGLQVPPPTRLDRVLEGGTDVGTQVGLLPAVLLDLFGDFSNPG